MKIINVVGTRPNFMKIAPIIKEMDKYSEIDHLLIHTGQHYDLKLSTNFFTELGIPEPDINLNIGSGSPTLQVAKIMEAFENICDEHAPDLVLVVGDVNSTMACTLVAAQKKIKVVHVEAGIRSYDRNMLEETNRLVTDSIANYLLPPSFDAVENLKREGHSEEKIECVGNVMIDTLKLFQPQVEKATVLEDWNITKGNYVAFTLHRPSNVDNKKNLQSIFKAIQIIQKNVKVVFPMHPRTKKMIASYGLENKLESMNNLVLTPPLGYLDFGKLVSNSKYVLTDSGGIQEETTVYGIPCITLRENTERPITIEIGTNVLAGCDTNKILSYVEKINKNEWKSGKTPELWDGKAAQRIVKFIRNITF